jgi:hypothetical protein
MGPGPATKLSPPARLTVAAADIAVHLRMAWELYLQSGGPSTTRQAHCSTRAPSEPGIGGALGGDIDLPGGRSVQFFRADLAIFGSSRILARISPHVAPLAIVQVASPRRQHPSPMWQPSEASMLGGDSKATSVPLDASRIPYSLLSGSSERHRKG